MTPNIPFNASAIYRLIYFVREKSRVNFLFMSLKPNGLSPKIAT